MPEDFFSKGGKAGKGRKQTPEQIAKRVAARRATLGGSRKDCLMPRFLNTEGNAVIAILICDRCRMKRAIVEAMPDPNFPGLKVCQQGCADEKYRTDCLHARQSGLLCNFLVQMLALQRMTTAWC